MDKSASNLSPARAIAMIILAAGLAVVGWIVLRGEAGIGTLAGRLADGRGQDIAGARVEIEELQLATISNDDGSFMFEDLSPGDYWLTAEAPSGAGVSLTVRVQRPWATDLGVIVIPEGRGQD